ncbi:hypothetical protein FRC11_009801, partial [Ceratobasidium sp. 423]
LGANVQQLSLLRFKRQRLTKEQLLKLQHAEANQDNIAMNPYIAVMTPDEMQALSELQREVAGEGIPSELDDNEPCPLNINLAAESDNEGSIGEDDEDDTWEDIIENVGRTGRSAWSNRLMNEHHAWMAELPALCNAYLDYRANASQPMAPTQTSGDFSTFSMTCIDLTGYVAFYSNSVAYAELIR